MYVSHEYYSQTFGGLLPEADFKKAEAKAEAVIGYLTYINGDIFAKEDNRVKLAVCAAAEVVHYHISFCQPPVCQSVLCIIEFVCVCVCV